ncbi:MAG: CDP-diacylglycerol--serine O-phosphatidyltransferase [Bdellovibrionaceae bacterium]|nr:CDP-diacylglycerol--serine O-phosphatidyltransferase [Pseudobdellovibrionaceae bacterium]MDW8189971.1 CDP-diacylglycerol--serine O-phosphatidyltransferase [Pseudobdellovibrionaceae bacterium]
MEKPTYLPPHPSTTHYNEKTDLEYEEFIAEPPKKLSIRIYLLPNLLTTGNIFCGFYSVILSIKGLFEWAAYAIVAASVFDMLDGRLARITRSTSKFGAEYDSMSDLVSFGFAPSLLLYLWALEPFGRLGWLSAFFFLACAALRLARFNVQSHVIEKAYFQGLPSPMAAGIIASSVLAFDSLDIPSQGSYLLLFMTLFLGVLMISTFRYRSFKDLDLKQRLPFKYLVAGVFIIAVVAYRPEVNLFLLFMTYAVLGAFFGVMGWGRTRLKRNPYLPKTNLNDPDLLPDPEESETKDKG